MNAPPLRIGPSHPRLAALAHRLTLALAEPLMKRAGFHRLNGEYAQQRLTAIRQMLGRGETVYLIGLATSGTHNTGAALVKVTAAHGPRLIVNNEEERFTGNKHTTEYPRQSLDAIRDSLRRRGKDIRDVAAVLTTWDYPQFLATIARTAFEEAPGSLKLVLMPQAPGIDRRRMDQMRRTPRIIAKQFGLSEPMPLICMPHHDNHAWFSFAASPFPDNEPVAVAVIDGTGDRGAISLYVAEHGEMRLLSCNDSVFDSLGSFYSVISSTQGGWTWLSSEGRYMGAAAWGDMNRATNPYYAGLRQVLDFGDNGVIRLNRAMANWHSDPFDDPYNAPLTALLGEALKPAQLWNPDAVLRVEDISHSEATQARLDKAAATQMVLEDAFVHIVDHLLQTTGARRLVLTGGVALNALANMRLLDHFDRAWFARAQNRDATLHLWVPPVPSDPGVPIGAAWRFAHLAGASRGAPITHAFYCGEASSHDEIASALAVDDIASEIIGDIATPEGRDAVADVMAFMVSQGGIIALFQGAAETGPRALGHRSILANPCDPGTRARLNARVKYREAIRPLAPMATLEAAQRFFVLQDGASDADYNAYGYMVLTARSKPDARAIVPAVIHADGTGRIQIVRDADDPLTYAYLKALGRRIGVEMSVNTSFNVAGPIAQTPAQAVETLRRAADLDVVLMIASDGTVTAAWHGGARDSGRFREWLAEWTRSHRTISD